MKQKQIAIHNHNLADQLLRGISIIFSEEKASESDIKQINGITILILFEDEKKEYFNPKRNKMI